MWCTYRLPMPPLYVHIFIFLYSFSHYTEKDAIDTMCNYIFTHLYPVFIIYYMNKHSVSKV